MTEFLERPWRSRERELAQRLSALHESLHAIAVRTNGIGPVPEVGWDTPGDFAEVASELVRFCVDATRRIADTDTSAELIEAAKALQQFGDQALDHEECERRERLADCATAFDRLRELTDLDDLAVQACYELVTRCGFGRAVVSRVDGNAWTPWKGYFGASTGGWFSEWIDRTITLDESIPESRLLVDPRVMAIHDTARESVYRPIIVDSGSSSSYVVAAIAPGGKTIGFVHCDHAPTARRVDDVDCDVLSAFAETLARLAERIVLAGQVRERQARTRDILADAVQRLDSRTGIEIGRGSSTNDPSVLAAVVAPFGELTARERDVIDLMGTGLTNSEIAEELLISTDTVKSHVKRILRKLGATNRSQAVVWLHGARDHHSAVGTSL